MLTTADVARALGVSPTTLAAWRRHRLHLPFVRIGRTVRYHAEDVQRVLASYRVM